MTWWWKVKLLGQFFIDGSRPNHEFLLTFILNFLWDWFGSFLVVFPRNIEIQQVEFLLLYLLWFSLNKQIIFRRKKKDFHQIPAEFWKMKEFSREKYLKSTNWIFRQIAIFILIFWLVNEGFSREDWQILEFGFLRQNNLFVLI